MRNIILAAFAALVIGIFGLGNEANAASDCGIFNTLCGKRGPTHNVDPNTLSKQEQELLKSRQRRVSGRCYFHEFDGGRAIGIPVFFAKSGALAGCPGNRLQFCINCAAFANGHKGVGAIFGVRTAVAYKLPRGTTGVWLPSDVSLRDVAWCDAPGGHVLSYTYERFN